MRKKNRDALWTVAERLEPEAVPSSIGYDAVRDYRIAVLESPGVIYLHAGSRMFEIRVCEIPPDKIP